MAKARPLLRVVTSKIANKITNKIATKPEAQKAAEDTKGKRVQFDADTWQALDVLARGRMMTFQEVADEAFRDLLRKHGQPYDTRDAFRRSAAKALKTKSSPQTELDLSMPKKKRPAKRRAR